MTTNQEKEKTNLEKPTLEQERDYLDDYFDSMWSKGDNEYV